MHRADADLVNEHFLVFAVQVKLLWPVDEIVLRFVLELELKVLQGCDPLRLVVLQ